MPLSQVKLLVPFSQSTSAGAEPAVFRMSVQTPPETRYWNFTLGLVASGFTFEIALQVMTLLVSPTFQTSSRAGEVTPVILGRIAKAAVEVSVSSVPAGGGPMFETFTL